MSTTDDNLTGVVGRKTTSNLTRYSAHTLDVVRAVACAAEEIFGEPPVNELEGSVSVSRAGKVIAKILPQEPGEKEFVLLGVSADYCPQDWPDMTEKFDGPFLIRESQFFFRPLPVEPSEAVVAAHSVFQQLKSKLI